MFSALKRVRAYEQIADEVRDRILKGIIRPGDKLPGERELAGQFGVNRSTVREAMKSLAELGLVVVRHGGGAVVQDYAARAGLQILPYLFSEGSAGNTELLVSLMESRRLFAVELTRLAVERATAAEQTELRALSEDLTRAAAAGDLDAVQRLDFDLIQSLARASHNAIFVLIMNSVRPVYEQQRELFVALFADPEPIAQAYRKIAACLDDRDAERAARAMDAVMRSGEAHVQDLLRATATEERRTTPDEPSSNRSSSHRSRPRHRGRGVRR